MDNQGSDVDGPTRASQDPSFGTESNPEKATEAKESMDVDEADDDQPGIGKSDSESRSMDSEVTTATNTTSFNEGKTDEAKDQIKLIDNDDNIELKWLAREGITHHRTSITVYRHSDINPHDELARTEVQEPYVKIPKQESQVLDGDILDIAVSCYGEQGFKDVLKTSYIVGGKTSVTKVSATKIENNPLKILVTWKSPSSTPDNYEITAFDHKGKKVKSDTTKKNEIEFQKLEKNFPFHFEVRAKYKESLGKKVKSNLVEKIVDNTKPRNVSIERDASNPSRNLILKWEEPVDKKNFLHYGCRLYYEDHNNYKEGFELEKTMEKTKQYFSLKSDTNHYAEVISFFNGKKIKAVKSNIVKTDKVTRKSFDIAAKGKPVIKHCQAVQREKKFYSWFEWQFPDLEEEHHNFIIVSCLAYVKEEGKSNDQQLKLIGRNSAEEKELNAGSSYTFSIKCAYKDLDSRVVTTAESCCEIHTELGSIPNFNVTWENEKIHMKWPDVKGAKSYYIAVTSETSPDRPTIEKDKITRTNHTIHMKDGFTFGSTCKFVLGAKGGKNKTQKLEKTVLIGGNYVATNVKLTKYSNQRRELMAQWNAPKCQAHHYELVLFEAESRRKIQTIEACKKTEYHFKKLKTSTSYVCAVTPICASPQMQKITTKSNIATTEKRITNPLEREKEFGLPEKISHSFVSSEQTSSVKLSWNKLHMGENYEISKFLIIVKKEEGYFKNIWNTLAAPEKEINPSDTELVIPDIIQGVSYVVHMETVICDLDEQTKETTRKKEYKFATDPTKTVINDCTWENGMITFSWLPVDGAKQYKLMVKNEFLHNKALLNKLCEVSRENDGCIHREQMNESLCIGRTCMVKVIVVAAGGKTAETDWKPQLIGGNSVPKNVDAYENLEEPGRTINLKFDHPVEKLPDKYKVSIIPDVGKRKEKYINGNNVTIKYLRQETIYKFEVFAIYGEEESEGSRSNKIKTKGKNLYSQLVSFGGSGKVSLKKATIEGNVNQVNVPSGPGFGKVRDLKCNMNAGDNVDLLHLSWKIPSFDNNYYDHKVEQYQVKITCNNEKVEDFIVDFVEELLEYKTQEFQLELGTKCNVEVTTIYEIIDKDQVTTSEAEHGQVYTRPCAPDIRHPSDSIKNDTLVVEWNDVKGATEYSIALYIDNVEKPLIVKNTGKETKWEKQFDEVFGYGRSYYIEVTSIGSCGKTNSSRTNRDTIGGDLVPRNVRATSNSNKVVDINTQVYLEWEAPVKTPSGYEIISEPAVDLKTEFDKKSCVVSGLKAGTDYIFKVFAIHNDKAPSKKIKSGGCNSNKIKTNPTPTQVKNVRVLPGPNPAVSLHVKWDKVAVEKENETTTYNICMKTPFQEQTRELEIKEEEFTFECLEPGQKYSFTVAGRNSDGLGKRSDEISRKTSFGKPRDLKLLPITTSPSSALQLNFLPAEGNPTKYFATLVCKSGTTESKKCEVKSGHLFRNLQSNSKYLVKIHANYAKRTNPSTVKHEALPEVNEGQIKYDEYTKEEEGPTCETNEALTAPPKGQIIKAKCTEEDGVQSSKEIYFDWKHEPGCSKHKIRIKCGGSVERELTLKGTNHFQYICQNETMRYFVQVCSKNDSGYFGDWSDEEPINLAPPALTGVTAKLQDSGEILVKCKKSTKDLAGYIMQPCIKGKTEEIWYKMKIEEEEAKFIFSPEKPSAEHGFYVWAKSHEDVEGRKVLSNKVFSRPPQGEIIEASSINISNTRISISWKVEKYCDGYQVEILDVTTNKSENNLYFPQERDKFTYECLTPGGTYMIKLRCTSNGVMGKWSAEKQVELAPEDIIYENEHEIVTEICREVKISWKRPSIPPAKYLCEIYCNEHLVETCDETELEHTFKDKLIPGSLCYCFVTAISSTGKMGKPAKSRIYKIQWSKPIVFLAQLDENLPSKRALIQWETPQGVTCFKLEIANINNGTNEVIELEETSYQFENGMPGNEYRIRLFCGYNRHYDTDYSEMRFTMKPSPPTRLSVETSKSFAGFIIQFHQENESNSFYNIYAKAITDEQDPTPKQTDQCKCILKNLDPGQQYNISVEAVTSDQKSKRVHYEGMVATYPFIISAIDSEYDCNQDELVFKWDPPSFAPDEYLVQWKAGNGTIIEENTQEEKFTLQYLEAAQTYSLRVCAVNSAGRGKMSEWKTFVTNPLPPRDIKVHPNMESPTTSLIVKFTDDRNSSKKYKITGFGLKTGKEFLPIETKSFTVTLHDLIPGERYKIKVQTIFRGKISEPAEFPE